MSRRLSIRDTRIAAVTAALLLAVLPALLPPAARGAGPGGSRPQLSAAFSVRGTNGYRIDVERNGGTLTVAVSGGRPPIGTFSRGGVPRPPSRGNGATSVYRAHVPGSDPRRIDARLGRLGRIAVDFEPSGRTRVTPMRSGDGTGCGEGVRVRRRLGAFVGTVEFQGEGGYTSVRAARVPGSVGTPLARGCAGASSSSRAAAVLSAVNRRTSTRFEAKTTAAGAVFLATWQEPLGDGIVVWRRAYAGAPRDAFTFGDGSGWARVSPPAPFTGSARYTAGTDGVRHWRGTLAATFPGIATPMTGPGFQAQLVSSR